MGMTVLGSETNTIFLKGAEAYKLHHEFTVATTKEVKRGQPVTLNVDGEVVPATGTSKFKDIIGYSIHNGKAGDLVTVAMKSYGIVYAMPNAALNAGPVAYDGLNTTQPSQNVGFSTPSSDGDGIYGSYKAAAADGSDLAGWALDKAEGANDLIRVAIY